MENDVSEDTLWSGRTLCVVRNDEEQYSIWPADEPPPAGWHSVGKSGTREECLSYIQSVWTDMRPRSLREAMERG